MTRRRGTRYWLVKAHRWAGLTACGWLLVLGATGIVLDHDEWAWARQMTVPENWLSQRVARLLPASVMRYVAMDEQDAARWLGGSERGLWWTEDRGRRWQLAQFAGSRRIPQVYGLVTDQADGVNGIWIATDDGIWRSEANGKRATRVALAGQQINGLAWGADQQLVGLDHHNRIFHLPTADPEQIRYTPVDSVQVRGLPDSVSFDRLIFDLHFGYGLLQRDWSTLINDVGGFALLMLPVSGFFYWWLPRRARRRQEAGKRRSIVPAMRWLYRLHAPLIGLVAALPILYFGITGVLLDHVFWLLDWGKNVELTRTSLPPVYHYDSLRGELEAIAANPNQPDNLLVSTRLGILETLDGGRTWQAIDALPAGGANLFREGDTLFASYTSQGHFFRRDGSNDWQPITGPTTGISSAVRYGDNWYLKNSKGFYSGGLATGFELTDMAVPALGGATVYLFLVDIHTGNIFHPQFLWVNDLISICAIVLVLTGPILWWRRKWL